MNDWEEQLGTARAMWSRWCRAVEEAGLEALGETFPQRDLDLGEGSGTSAG